ncbi:MAG: hypothetical protein EZS28_030205 [Streblomastix strix]|uniref:Uncharacterized protein n=1 Tax=Streblomastix strix TaxID=222440 RepID=A0A5J4UWJ8_9EUKA|nr:MAG: hypothetical protein EZS28_030205 [Streblomastix strix]
MDGVHFYNMDTDSMHLAIAGSKIEGYKYGLNLYNGNEQTDGIVSLVNRMKGVSEKKANLTTNDNIKCLKAFDVDPDKKNYKVKDTGKNEGETIQRYE